MQDRQETLQLLQQVQSGQLGPEEALEGCLAGLMDMLGCRKPQVRLPPWSQALGGEKEPFAMVPGRPDW